MRENYFLEFRRLQNNVTCFIYKWHFYKQDMVEIWINLKQPHVSKGVKRKIL